jgi:hypothetical protein
MVGRFVRVAAPARTELDLVRDGHAFSVRRDVACRAVLCWIAGGLEIGVVLSVLVQDVADPLGRTVPGDDFLDDAVMAPRA